MPVSFPITISEDSDFSISNIPFGIFSPAADNAQATWPRAGTAVGDYVLDLDVLERQGLFRGILHSKLLAGIFSQRTLNTFAALPSEVRRNVRTTVIELLTDGSSPLFANQELNQRAFFLRSSVALHLPMDITDYSDSLCNLVHSQNCFGPLGAAFPAAFYDFPLAYNGRNSGVVVSGTDVERPKGLYALGDGQRTTFQPTQKLDFEIELGIFISKPVKRGETISAKDASEHIFGFVLLNDWSARDIQKQEMAPLGYFHSKAFTTSISPWVVTLDALRKASAAEPASSRTQIVSTLITNPSDHGNFDISFSAKVSRNGAPDVTICRSNAKHAYWSPHQIVAYHSLSGAGLNTGDLLGTGTHSAPNDSRSQGDDSKSPTPSNCGCLVEVFGIGQTLPSVGGKPMGYLENGDRLTIDGWFKTADGGTAGFGSVTGLISG